MENSEKKPKHSLNETESERRFWTDEQSDFIMAKYEEYFPEIGPTRQFHQKKDMWEEISRNIMDEFGVHRSDMQICNRFKTVMRCQKKRRIIGPDLDPNEIEDSLYPKTCVENRPKARRSKKRPFKSKKEEHKAPKSDLTALLETLMNVEKLRAHAKAERESRKREWEEKKEANRERRHDDLMAALTNL